MADNMSAWVAGSARPEKKVLRIGFLPLSDCGSLVMASLLGFDEKYGIKIELSREASWASMRDKLGNGELDAAHVLYGLIYGVQAGIGGQARNMAVLMNLHHNGQAVTLSSALANQGAVDGPTLAALIHSAPRPYTFAHTFPTGTHAMYLHYWLAAHGIDPLREVRMVTVPPPQMVDNLRAGRMDGYCVGEPWGMQAVHDAIGVTAATTQEIWPDHPGKVLGTNADFADKYPNTCRALIAAVLDAGRWLDASIENKQTMLETISQPHYVKTAQAWNEQHGLQFYNNGSVNFPYLSDGMWFMTQHRRWGLLKDDPDYLAVASKVNRINLYKQAAEMTATPLPPGVLRSSTLIDGVVWDGTEPERYAASFAIRK